MAFRADGRFLQISMPFPLFRCDLLFEVQGQPTTVFAIQTHPMGRLIIQDILKRLAKRFWLLDARRFLSRFLAF